MKKYYFLIIVALILGLVLTGCSLLSNIGQAPATGQSGIYYLTKGVPSGLVGLWHLDELSGTTASDSSGVFPLNNGTLYNFVSPWVSGMFGQALSFDGVDDYVDCGSVPQLDGVSEFTVEFWIKVDTLPFPNEWQGIIARGSTFQRTPWIYGNRNESNLRIHFETTLGGPGDCNFVTDNLTEGQWHHVAFTWDGNMVSSYLDGVPGPTDMTTSSSVLANTDESLKFGFMPSYTYFNGTIDEVRIWDKALSPDDILNPAISVVKIADTEFAYPGDTVTYEYIVTNTGYVPLSNVDVIDSLGITGNYDSGDTNGNDLLDLEEDWMFTAEYIIPGDAPERLCNTATAEGLYEGDPVVSTTSNEVCIRTMCARTIGYWKNHEDWCTFPRGSMFADKEYSDLVAYFPGSGAQEDGVNPLEMFRAQLIAAELNYACFEDDFHYTRYEAADIFGTIRDAEALLKRVYLAADDDDLNAFWADLSKQQQNNVKKIANPLKDTLEEFNEMGDEIWE